MDRFTIQRGLARITLLDSELEQAYRFRKRQYLTEDAKYRIGDYIEDADAIIASPWLLKEEELDDGTLDEVIARMVETFENRKSSEIPDSDIWEHIVETELGPLLSKRMADHIIEHLMTDIVDDRTAWTDLSRLIRERGGSMTSEDAEIIRLEIHGDELLQNPDGPAEAVIETIRRVLADIRIDDLSRFCVANGLN